MVVVLVREMIHRSAHLHWVQKLLFLLNKMAEILDPTAWTFLHKKPDSMAMCPGVSPFEFQASVSLSVT